jgi:hypothetical protein
MHEWHKGSFSSRVLFRVVGRADALVSSEPTSRLFGWLGPGLDNSSVVAGSQGPNLNVDSGEPRTWPVSHSNDIPEYITKLRYRCSRP